MTARCSLAINQLIVVSLAALLLGQPVSAQTPDDIPSLETEGPLADPPELESFIDGVMAALLEAHKVAGGTISVVKDGDIFFAKGYGYADAERNLPVDPAASMFRIASVSKLFAWTGVMQLWEQGQLDLDRDVNSYLDFEIPATFPEPITLTHLLTHTAGFEDRYKGLFADGPEDMAPLGEVLAKNIPARVLPPGEVDSYSNYGVGLAGYIVERVSGIPFEQYVEEKIYAPLGMTHSTFRQPVQAELEADLAAGHSYRAGTHEVQDFEYDPAVADGAMSTSAVDMAHFMIAHLQLGSFGGQRILEEATARRMHSRLFSPDPRIPGTAHGFYEVNANERRGIAHGGDLLYFHSDLLLLPEEGVGLFVSFNSDSGYKARDEIVSVFLDRYFPKPEVKPVEPPADLATRAARYAGWYRMNRYSYETLEKVMLLTIGDMRITATDDGHLLVALMGEESRFVEVDPLLIKLASGSPLIGIDRIAFEENDAGEIIRAHPMPTIALDRLSWWDTVYFQLSLLVACTLAFLNRLVRAFRDRKRLADRSPLTRWNHRLATAVSVLNLAFLASFVVMLFQALETYLLPDSIYVLLVLPVISALLTLGIAGLAVLGWIKSDGAPKNRILTTAFCAMAVGFLWFLNYWNLLGWHY